LKKDRQHNDQKKKDNQWFTENTGTHKTKDWVTRTPLKTGGEFRCSRRVSSSWPTCGTHRVNLVTNPVISHEWGKDRDRVVFTTSGTYQWPFLSQIFHSDQPSQCGDRKSTYYITKEIDFIILMTFIACYVVAVKCYITTEIALFYISPKNDGISLVYLSV
jgi:hypothetical protein